MREIIVYDFEFGSQELADYLERELPVVVTRMIDPRKISECDNREVQEMVVEAVRPYIGRAEVIVVTNPLVVAVALERLRGEFPRQIFVGYGQKMEGLISRMEKVFVLAPGRMKRMEMYQKMKAKCQETEINELDPARWMGLIKRGWLAKEEMTEEAKRLGGAKVVIIDPEMVVYEQKVEEMVGWRGEVVDMKAELLRQVKTEMGLEKWC